MATEDYTAIALGTRVGNGEIHTCPHCGQRGILEIVNGKNWYIHSQTTDAAALRIEYDMCPKTAE